MDERTVISVFSDEEIKNSPNFFEASQWINKGRRFRDTPAHVQLAFERLLVPPVSVYKLLPSIDVSPTTLVLMSLPQWDESLDDIDDQRLTFSATKPTFTQSSFDNIASIPLLSMGTIRRLRGMLGQAWLDDMESIFDGRTGDAHWPFWMLSVVSHLRRASRAKATWCASFAWLDNVEASSSTSESSLALCNQARWLTSDLTRWEGHITARGFDDIYLEHVADILGDNMLRSGIIDALVDGISDELDRKWGTQRGLLVVGTIFSVHIADATYRDPSDRNYKFLQKYATLFQPGSPHRYLCFPYHSPPLHFATGLIDFRTGRVRLGDPLSLPRPKWLFESLTAWLQQNFRDIDVQITDDLPCAVQRDGFNCPIISVNTLSHVALGTKIWVEEMGVRHRLEAFNWILQNILDAQEHETDTYIADPTESDRNIKDVVDSGTSCLPGTLATREAGTCPLK